VIVLFDALTTPVEVPLTDIDAVAPVPFVLTVTNAPILAAPLIADLAAVYSFGFTSHIPICKCK
jgi:hypothetical protein